MLLDFETLFSELHHITDSVYKGWVGGWEGCMVGIGGGWEAEGGLCHP